MIVVGVDPGTVTGLARWDTRAGQLLDVESSSILRAMDRVLYWAASAGDVLVIVEDARKRQVFDATDAKIKKYGHAIREGVGSVKRDSAIWEEFLTSRVIPHYMRRPIHTKQDANFLKRVSGWTARTNEHARDAAFVVVGLNTPQCEGIVRTWQQTARKDKGSLTAPSSTKGAASAGTRARSCRTASDASPIRS